MRIANNAKPGELLAKKRRSKGVHPDTPGQRKPRMMDNAYLALIRQLPCVRCGRSPSQAAHVRMSAPGELPVGMGRKPDDSRVLPVCQWCHLDAPDSIHRGGEEKFYQQQGLDPIELSGKLYAAKSDFWAMLNMVFMERRDW